jgi:hypothetical protein
MPPPRRGGVADRDPGRLLDLDPPSAIDAHLLASIRLTPGSTLWTRDRRLSAVAMTFDVQAPPPA